MGRTLVERVLPKGTRVLFGGVEVFLRDDTWVALPDDQVQWLLDTMCKREDGEPVIKDRPGSGLVGGILRVRKGKASIDKPIIDGNNDA